MIKLIDILKEAKQVGLLYHSTSGENLNSILRSNTLKGNQDSNYAMTAGIQISFTRDKNYRPGEYTIEIDGDKLSNNYKITPFAYDQDERGQAEEVVKQDIKDFKKYIKNIYANVEVVQNKSFKEIEKIMQLYPSLRFTIGGEVDPGEGGGSEAVRELPKAEAITYIKYNKY